jgi:hypothetical protein
MRSSQDVTRAHESSGTCRSWGCNPADSAPGVVTILKYIPRVGTTGLAADAFLAHANTSQSGNHACGIGGIGVKDFGERSLVGWSYRNRIV